MQISQFTRSICADQQNNGSYRSVQVPLTPVLFDVFVTFS